MEVDAKGLCAIIKTCHNANVSHLKFGDVEVSFVTEDLVNKVPHETVHFEMPEVEPLGSGEVSMELSADQKAIMSEAEETDLMITNPQEWETVLVDRLVHKDRALDENRRTERVIPQG